MCANFDVNPKHLEIFNFSFLAVTCAGGGGGGWELRPYHDADKIYTYIVIPPHRPFFFSREIVVIYNLLVFVHRRIKDFKTQSILKYKIQALKTRKYGSINQLLLKNEK